MGDQKGGPDVKRQPGRGLPPLVGPDDEAPEGGPVVGRNGAYQTGTVPASPLAIATSGPKNRPSTMIGIAPPSPGSVTPPTNARQGNYSTLPLPEPASSQRLAAAPPVPLATASGDVTRLNPIVAPIVPPQARGLGGALPRRATPAPPPAQGAPLPAALPPLAPPSGKPGNGRVPLGLDWDDDVKTTVYDRQAQEEAARLQGLHGKPMPANRLPSSARAPAPVPASSRPPPPAPASSRPPGPPPTPASSRPPPPAPAPDRVIVNRAEPAPPPVAPAAQAVSGVPPFGAVPFGPTAGRVPPPAARTGHAMPSMARMVANEPTQLTRARPGIKPLVVAGLALVGFVVVGALFLAAQAFLTPRTSKLLVNVKADGRPLERAQVFVDGKAAACDAIPCRVKDVAAGARSVRVVAEGYEENTEVVEAEEKKEKPVTIELRRSAKASTGFRLRGPSSVRLFVDGKEVGTLPQEVRDLAPGDHQLKLVSSNLYKPEDRTVSVTESQISDLGQVALKVARGRATFVLGKNAQGAKVTLVSDSDRRTVGSFPITVELDTSKQWTLEASKPNHDDFSQALLFDDGEAERTFTIALQEKGHAAAPARAPDPTPAPPPRAAPPTAATPAAAPAENDAPKASGDATGFLNLNSIPPSTCIVDGKTLGPTPRSSVALPPGSHSVVFVHPELGRKALTVTLGAGETKSAAVRFP